MRAAAVVAVLAGAGAAPAWAQAGRTDDAPPPGAWRLVLADDGARALLDTVRVLSDSASVTIWLRLELTEALTMPDGGGGHYRITEVRQRVLCPSGPTRTMEVWLVGEDTRTFHAAPGMAGPVIPAQNAVDSLMYADICRQVRPPVRDLFAALKGRWDWTGEKQCVDNPHEVSFSGDHRTMTLTFRHEFSGADQRTDNVARYEIRAVTPTSIRAFLVDESRRTESGELVAWDLMLMTPGSYHWHRTDWGPGQYTRAIVRCP